MATLLVPTEPTEELYTLEMTLDGLQYKLRFRWNARANLWMMDVYLTDGTKIQLGTPVVTGTFLTRMTRIANTPAGDFYAFATDSNYSDAGKKELGARVVLHYLEAADIAELFGL